MAIIELFWYNADDTVIADGVQVSAYTNSVSGALIESQFIGSNGMPLNQGGTAFSLLTPGSTYRFHFSSPNADAIITLPATPQIIVGAQGPPGNNGTNGTNGTQGIQGIQGIPGTTAIAPYDIIQTTQYFGTGSPNIFNFLAPRTMTISASGNIGGTHQIACINANNTQTVVYGVYVNTTEIATISFPPATSNISVGTFTFSNHGTLSAGDTLSIQFVSASDSSAVDIIAMYQFSVSLCPVLT